MKKQFDMSKTDTMNSAILLCSILGVASRDVTGVISVNKQKLID